MSVTMSGKGLSYGLNLTKKKSFGSRSAPAKRKPIFTEEDTSDSDGDPAAEVQEIGEVGALSISPPKLVPRTGPLKSLNGSKPKTPRAVNKAGPSVYGDLSTNFSSKKHAHAAEEIDASIYDYDAVYDSLKPQKITTDEDKERRPKYMSNLLAAAAVRKRDATIAEEKKLAREREAEGDEFADKEKFVTSAYKNQQEENRRLEAEEKIREAEELKINKGGGMTGFFKNVLEKGEQRHAEIVKAAEVRAKHGPMSDEIEDSTKEQSKTEADVAKEINEKHTGAIAVDDEGNVVDRRQLLKGGLNIASKAKAATPASVAQRNSAFPNRDKGGHVGVGGSKQAMRERQTRMMEAQLEQATKRSLEVDQEEQKRVERAAKSRKTDGEIMSAKERYLARKREAEEAKRNGETS